MAIANFIGVYSSVAVPAARRQVTGMNRKRYWFVWEDGWGRYRVQLLDAAYEPLDTPRIVGKEEFLSAFKLESSILVTPVTRLEIPDEPAEIHTQPLESEASFREPPSYTAEQTPAPVAEPAVGEHLQGAYELDHDLRGEFAVALARLRRGEQAAASMFFERLVLRTEGIIPAHKHMFTDFGTDLRKAKLPAMAFKFYQRALELAPEDSNAYFNVARIMFELGDYDGALQHLQQALKIDENFADAQHFSDFITSYLAKRRPKSRRGVKTSRDKNMHLNLSK